LVWLTAGIVSLGLHPVSESLSLLHEVGVPAAWAPAALYAACALDIGLGLLTVSPWRGRWLWLLQGVVVLAYTAILTVQLPEFWLHPFGPLAKNLPLLAVLWLLYEQDRKP